MLEAAESDARDLGAKGVAAWGLLLPMFMRASWFRKHGYQKADRQGMFSLVWKPFADDAEPPRWIRPKCRPVLEPNKVTVTAFCSGWCTAQNSVFERAKRAAAEQQFEGKVVFRPVSTLDRLEFLQCGIADALYIDDKEVRNGPPPSYDAIRKLIRKRVQKLKLAV